VERSIKKDETTYSLYSPLWEKAPVIDKEYTEANNKDNVYIYNLGYLPDDFHTISTKCLHSEYAMTRDEI
jgi:hypothetical protein